MTRSSLNRTLRRAYVVLGLVLLLSLASKFADRIPWIAGTPIEGAANDLYDYLKDMALVFVTVVAAYLANVFQKRSNFVGSLEEEWRGIVRTKSALYTFCEKQYASTDDYLAAFCRISETIDNMRIVYGNAGETADLVGLYPYAPLHDMRRALQSIDPRKRSDISAEEKKLARDAILQSFYALRENYARGARPRRAGASAADFGRPAPQAAGGDARRPGPAGQAAQAPGQDGGRPVGRGCAAFEALRG